MELLWCVLVQFARERAAELETFSQTAEAPPQKKVKTEEEKGEGEVDRFLSAVCALPLAELGEESARARLAGLVAELSSSSCPEVRAVLDSASCC